MLGLHRGYIGIMESKIEAATEGLSQNMIPIIPVVSIFSSIIPLQPILPYINQIF